MTFETPGAPRPAPGRLDTGSAWVAPSTPSHEYGSTARAVMAEVLVVDADESLRALATYLLDNGVSCEHVPRGEVGLQRLLSGVYDAGIVDAEAAGLDARELLQRVREKSNVPIIVLTDRSTAAVRANWLEAGADDSLSKPVSPRELLARVRAILRRRHSRVTGDDLRAGPLLLDLANGVAQVGPQRVVLTPLEFDLLAALVRRAGRVVRRASLLSLAGRQHAPVGERTVDVHIARLRKKLGAAERGFGRCIGTVRGVGYVLAAGP
ncbi:MAG TPA: response regulator transcription factor [Polyangiaceae bacterium]|nr:response regulator transcription factor [Polyangiaceae bacterium]